MFITDQEQSSTKKKRRALDFSEFLTKKLQKV